MDLKHAKGKGLAWLCIALGMGVAVFSALRLARGEGGSLLAVVALPLLAYGVLMLRAVRRVGH